MTLLTPTAQPARLRLANVGLLVFLAASMVPPRSVSAASYDRGDAARYYGVRQTSSVAQHLTAPSSEPNSHASRTRLGDRQTEHPPVGCATRTVRALSKLVRLMTPLTLLLSGDAAALPGPPVAIWPQTDIPPCDIAPLVYSHGGDVLLTFTPSRALIVSLPPTVDADWLTARCGYALQPRPGMPADQVARVKRVDLDNLHALYDQPHLENAPEFTFPLPPPSGPSTSRYRWKANPQSPQAPLKTPSAAQPSCKNQDPVANSALFDDSDIPHTLPLRMPPSQPLLTPTLTGSVGATFIYVTLTGAPPTPSPSPSITPSPQVSPFSHAGRPNRLRRSTRTDTPPALEPNALMGHYASVLQALRASSPNKNIWLFRISCDDYAKA